MNEKALVWVMPEMKISKNLERTSKVREFGITELEIIDYHTGCIGRIWLVCRWSG